jgi:undecaprenyl-diphosphatase
MTRYDIGSRSCTGEPSAFHSETPHPTAAIIMLKSWFDAIASLVTESDLWILHGLNQLSGNPVIDNTVDFICADNLLRGALPAAIYWYVWFNHTPRQQLNRVGLVKGVIAAIVAVILARGLSHLLPLRLRPFVDPASGFVPFLEPNPGNFENWSAFPSDTAAFVFAIGWSLSYISRLGGITLLVFTAITACLTRIYIGVHYPSDIVVGAMIGILTAWMLHKVTIPGLADSEIIHGKGNHPWFYFFAFFVTSEVAQVFDNVRTARRFSLKLLPYLHHTHIFSLIIINLTVAALITVVLFLVLAYRHRRNREIRRHRHPAILGSPDSLD